MEYQIDGGVLPVVTLFMQPGEQVYTQSGGMAWMTDSFKMETNTKGGVFKGIGRMLAGESLFMNTYTAKEQGGQIAFASSFPGAIVKLDLSDGKSYICQKTAFLCAQPTVNLSMYVNKKIGTGFFGGEGFIMQKLEGSGLAFLECDGSVTELDIPAGVRLIVSTGKVAAFESSVTMSVEAVKGFKNMFLGGEGLFLTTLTGPGKVYLQSITIEELAGKLAPYLPHQTATTTTTNNNNSNSGNNNNNNNGGGGFFNTLGKLNDIGNAIDNIGTHSTNFDFLDK